MKRYVIEREIPGIGTKKAIEYAAISKTSNDALAQLAPRVIWERSYFTRDKTFCIYLAENEEAVLAHSRISGIPAHRITEVVEVVGPETANQTEAA